MLFISQRNSINSIINEKEKKKTITTVNANTIASIYNFVLIVWP